jgi:hypothetical protein
MSPPHPAPDPRAAEPAADAPADGRTRAVQSDGAAPRLPHERDESDDSQAGAGDAGGQHDIGQQALDDLRSGQTDTGRLPVTDRVYDRLKKPGR